VGRGTGVSIIFINPYSFAAAAATDPDFASVSLLLHGDGTNGSTTITDNSPSPKTVTAVGNAQISTAQSKFGGASIAFDGSGDFLTTSASADLDFGVQDFTIELWHRFNNTTLDRGFVGNGSNGRLDFIWRTSTGINLGRINTAFDSTFAWSPSVNVWYHIAISRSGTSLRAFIDGVQIGSTVTNSINYNASSCIIGSSLSNARNSNGYIDDLRITKGVARYTANFTPPTAPFPDA
jgi:hypothetical protein